MNSPHVGPNYVFDDDVRQDADRVTDVALEKEEQDPATIEQTLKATDGEGNASAVVNEWKTDVSEVQSSKERTPPYMSPKYIASDQEVSQ